MRLCCCPQGANHTFSLIRGIPSQDVLSLEAGALVQLEVHLVPAQAVYGHQRLCRLLPFQPLQ